MRNGMGRSIADFERARIELEPISLALRAYEFDSGGIGIECPDKSRIRGDEGLPAQRILICDTQNAGAKGWIGDDGVRRPQGRWRRDGFRVSSRVEGISGRSQGLSLQDRLRTLAKAVHQTDHLRGGHRNDEYETRPHVPKTTHSSDNPAEQTNPFKERSLADKQTSFERVRG
jgi:hypothetical protein